MIKMIDSDKGWKVAQMVIEQGVKKGELTREKAKKLLEDARTNYRNQSYNRQAEVLNAQNR